MIKRELPALKALMENKVKEAFSVTVIGQGGQSIFKSLKEAERFIQTGLEDGSIGRHGAYLETWPTYSRRLYTKKNPKGAPFEMPRTD